jgi:hypothetical protein
MTTMAAMTTLIGLLRGINGGLSSEVSPTATPIDIELSTSLRFGASDALQGRSAPMALTRPG